MTDYGLREDADSGKRIISSPRMGGHRIILWAYGTDPDALHNLCLIFKNVS
jgi:hypothetical protein